MNRLQSGLHREAADIEVTPLADGKRRVQIHPCRQLFVTRDQIVTAYPESLIGRILDVKGPEHLCDEIARDEDASYVAGTLELGLLGYCSRSDFAGKRLLDFGCGAGASTMILARMFPNAEIVGIELCPDLLSLAQERLRYYKYENVRLMLSPSGTELPPNCGKFDFAILSAVVEHLLPQERKTVLPLLWRALNTNGILFVNQTPHRYFPVETHTTQLPLLNYLPDGLTLAVARRFCGRVAAGETWEELLRRGIRGSTEREIRRMLGADASLLHPSQRGLRDPVDLWYSALGPRFPSVKRMLKPAQRLVYGVTGSVLAPNITAAYKKAEYRVLG